uniref:Uncharacterized protein n=1 Tax=Oryza barthii TaxID=65489 RepID=A0A0D3FV70_9ORYZ
MVRPAHDDSLPLAASEVTARLVRRAAPKRRVAELDVEAQQASAVVVGCLASAVSRYSPRSAVVVGCSALTVSSYSPRSSMHMDTCLMRSDIPAVASSLKDQACGSVSDSELPPDGGFVPDSEDEASGSVDDSELPPDGCVVPDSEDEASGGFDDSDLPTDGYVIPDSEDEESGGVHDSELPPEGCVVPDSEDEESGGVHDSELPPKGCVVPDFEDEESGGGVHNLEQKPDKDISANLEEQHMDGIEQLVGGEEVAGLQDDAGVAARDEGVDEFAEIRETPARRSAADELDEATRAQADPDYLLFLSHLYPDGGGAAAAPSPSSSTYVLDIPDLGLVVRYGPFVIGGDGDGGGDAASNKNATVGRRQLSSAVVINNDDLPPPSAAREAEVADSAASRSSVASNDDDDLAAAGTVDDGEEVSNDGVAVAGEEGAARGGRQVEEMRCVVPDSEDEESGGVHDCELPPEGCVVPDSEDEESGGVHDSELPPKGCVVPDFEDEESGGGVHNLEQKPDKDISANLEEQHMDGIEQLVGGEEVAGLQDDAGVAARDEGVDEFAEIRERNLFARLLHNCFPRN